MFITQSHLPVDVDDTTRVIRMGDGIGMWNACISLLLGPLGVNRTTLSIATLTKLYQYVSIISITFYCHHVCNRRWLVAIKGLKHYSTNDQNWQVWIILHMASHQVGSRQRRHSERLWKMIAIRVWFSRVETSPQRAQRWWTLHSEFPSGYLT